MLYVEVAHFLYKDYASKQPIRELIQLKIKDVCIIFHFNIDMFTVRFTPHSQIDFSAYFFQQF
jgi:hypothetical protein